MFTRFKSPTRRLFLDPQKRETIEIERGEKLEIVLSPALYWVKRIELPVSTVREAKKLLPSIFEDILPPSHYSYTAFKRDEAFFIFAYEDKKILELLHQKGVNPAQVRSVHFAQTEFSTLEGAIKINEREAIYLQDEVLVITPLSWVRESQNLDLEERELSKESIKLQQFGHIVDNSSLYKIGAVMLLFALLLGVEIFISASKRDAVLASKDALFSKYELLPTMMQNRSMLSKYSKIYKTQMHLREYISYFLSMQLNNGEKIVLMDYENKRFFVTLSGVTKSRSRALLAQLDAKKVHYKSSLHGENMRVEIEV